MGGTARGAPSLLFPNTPDGRPSLCPVLGLSGLSMLVEVVGQARCVGLGAVISGSTTGPCFWALDGEF